MIQIFAHQYRETLTNEQVNAMDWSIKVKYEKKKIKLLQQGKLIMYSSNYGVKLFEVECMLLTKLLNIYDRRSFKIEELNILMSQNI